MDQTKIPDTIKLMMSHTSVRDFTSEPVSEEDRRLIFEAARAASSSCFLQLTSVIRISDPERRKEIAKLAGNQKHVAEAPELWIFCCDLHRNLITDPNADIGWTEQLVTAVQDTGIFGENAMLALEALGLGGCFIGGIRNSVEAVDKLLELPQNVFPLFGIAFGHPASKNQLKPRLPVSITMMDNVYKEPDPKTMDEYSRELSDYYLNRSSNAKAATWPQTVTATLGKERRPFLGAYLKKKDWNLK